MLDSSTGKQVFDTLKKLSKNKLVIIVSHDREYAEIYADRIIEMKDGVILSDETKRYLPPQEISSGLNVIGTNIIQIEKGHSVTDEELKLIGKFLKQNNEEILISTGETDNRKFKEISKISENGHTEQFSETTTKDFSGKEYNKKDLKLIKSKLKLKDSFKMGASGLKSKPVRLVFTIILCLVAFTLFGITDTMAAYNKTTTTVNSIIDSNYSTLAFSGQKKRTSGTSSWFSDCNLFSSNISNIKQKTGVDVKPVYSRNGSDYSLSNSFAQSSLIRTGFYSGSIYSGSVVGFADYSKTELEDLGCQITGTMPQTNDEIAITTYTLSHFKVAGFKQCTGVTPNGVSVAEETLSASNVTESSIIGKYISLQNVCYKITAVVNTNFDDSDYSDMKSYGSLASNASPANSGNSSYFRISELTTNLTYGLHSLCFVTPAYFRDYSNHTTRLSNRVYYCFPVPSGTGTSFYDIGFDYTAEFDSLTSSDYKFFAENYVAGKKLDSNELLVDVRAILRYLFGMENTLTLSTQAEEYKTTYNSGLENRNSLLSNAEFLTWLSNNKTLLSSCWFGQYDMGNMEQISEFKIVGFYITPFTESYNDYILIGNEDFFKNYCNGVYSFAIMKTPNKTALKTVVNYYYALESSKDVAMRLVMQNNVISTLSIANTFIEQSSKVFLYLGIGFAVFAGLMLMNYISTSISYKKREIGILRAIGARKKDVFSIFFNESLIIAIINFILSSISTFCFVILINSMLRKDMGLSITLLDFTARQVILLLAISIVVALIASALPVYKIAKKQPIDAINNR